MINEEYAAPISAVLAADRATARVYPGDPTSRQPVHTVYGGAHLFKSGTAAKLAELARVAWRDYAPDAATLQACFGDGDSTQAQSVHQRVTRKLQDEAVEDFRIDFEDGYGPRPDAEEDAHAIAAADEVVRALSEQALPPFFGVRVKAFAPDTVRRAVRTLDLFISKLVHGSGGKLPANFVVTLPKVAHDAQVQALTDVLDILEHKLHLPRVSLALEIMVETPQALIAADGTCPLPTIVRAARGRCVATHFGAYDFTAACNIVAQEQTMLHPACDFARQLMSVSLAGVGVRLSDGATTLIPAAPHKGRDTQLTDAQRQENRAAIWRAWRESHRHVWHALKHGFYQGWDLHPAQIPPRYVAVFSFFLQNLRDASARLRTFLERAAQATLSGDTFDDAATGQGLLNFFLRGHACGALDATDVRAAGIELEELETRSFAQIMAGRAGKASRLVDAQPRGAH